MAAERPRALAGRRRRPRASSGQGRGGGRPERQLTGAAARRAGDRAVALAERPHRQDGVRPAAWWHAVERFRLRTGTQRRRKVPLGCHSSRLLPSRRRSRRRPTSTKRAASARCRAGRRPRPCASPCAPLAPLLLLRDALVLHQRRHQPSHHLDRHLRVGDVAGAQLLLLKPRFAVELVPPQQPPPLVVEAGAALAVALRQVVRRADAASSASSAPHAAPTASRRARPLVRRQVLLLAEAETRRAARASASARAAAGVEAEEVVVDLHRLVPALEIERDRGGARPRLRTPPPTAAGSASRGGGPRRRRRPGTPARAGANCTCRAARDSRGPASSLLLLLARPSPTTARRPPPPMLPSEPTSTFTELKQVTSDSFSATALCAGGRRGPGRARGAGELFA